MDSLSEAAWVDGRVQVRWADGRVDAWGPWWLRDNCRCPQCRHPGNGQKLYGVADLPADLQPRQVQPMQSADGHALQVQWSDGHASIYLAQWLLQHRLDDPARQARREPVQLWDGHQPPGLPQARWPDLLADPAVELAWLERFAALGFGLLRDVPREPGSVAEVGDRLGYVRVTNYGRLFDVKSVPNPTNMAYTAVGLGVHSDNPYRHPSPGVQLLHCLECEAPGGDTLLVDGFMAAECLRREDPGAFELLSRLPMNFRYADADTELRARQTLISTDHEGQVTAVHVNNRSADWLDADAGLAESWYAAYRQFARVLLRPELERVFRLEAGDCVVMQNDRTLHGRTAFDPQLGRRHLQGCYIDRDAMDSRRRVLQRRLRPT
ncbi:MAG: DUF971 domain-containing protein [Rhodoferax sp.]|nr:DUF971 domain-containing protein [Rhodoferax sp.]